ncbi:ABC transporter substrate-binding protein [Brassicibacter mesophilus]|uniref:ABC transporter substrate-binding protein n=1 Tax=Brassicibacter mesophilus TaxID=745119 RepID=UPI003D1A52E6
MKKTRILSLFLVVAMFATVMLSGCSNNSGDSNTVTTEDGKEKVTIKFWHVWKGEEADMLQEVIDDFNATNDHIFVESLGGTDTQKQLTAITGGNPPDIGYLLDINIPQLASVGSISELDPYIEKFGMDKENVLSEMWNIGNYEGKQYGIPYTVDTYMLFYNKDLFEEAGLDGPPKTTSELIEYSQKLTKKDDNGDYTQVGYISDYPWVDQMLWAFVFGSDFYDFENDKVTCDNQTNIDALKFKLKSYEAPYEPEKIKRFKSGFGKYMSPNNPFFQNQLAMDIEGEYYTSFVNRYASDLNYGVAPVPYPDGHPELANGGLLQGGMLYIPENSKHKEEAFEFINYLKSDDAYIKFCAGKGSMPTTFSALNDKRFVEAAPELAPFIEVLNNGTSKAMAAVPFAREYLNELKLQEEKAYNFEVTPEEAMKAVVDKIQPLADEWAKKKNK